MNKGTSIYICVGGYGNGYNNRIPGVGTFGTPGGGATSITTTNRGELSNFNSFRGEVLIVAGGGGAQDAGENSPRPVAGVGGGLDGGDAYGSGCNGLGARQYQPGSNSFREPQNCPHNYTPGFGYGGVASRYYSGWDDPGAQGGGGYYGGGGTQQAGPAGGGSSYYGGLNSSTTIAGNGYQPSPDGDTQQLGQSGSGHCVVSWFLK